MQESGERPDEATYECETVPSDAAPESGDEGSASIEDLEALRKAAAERDQFYERLQRVYADYDNYRKRVKRERAEWEVTGIRKLASDLLHVADYLDMTLASAVSAPDSGKLLDGVKMVREELHKILSNYGVEPMDAEGKPFDPNYHEAVAQEVTEQHPPGVVTGEVRKGYVHGDRVLRATRVKVSAAPPQISGKGTPEKT